MVRSLLGRKKLNLVDKIIGNQNTFPNLERMIEWKKEQILAYLNLIDLQGIPIQYRVIIDRWLNNPTNLDLPYEQLDRIRAELPSHERTIAVNQEVAVPDPVVYHGSRQNPNYYWTRVNGDVHIGDPIDIEGNVVYTDLHNLENILGTSQRNENDYRWEREVIQEYINSEEQPEYFLSLLCSQEFHNELVKRFKKVIYLRFYIPKPEKHEILGVYKILAFNRVGYRTQLFGNRVEVPDDMNQFHSTFIPDQEPHFNEDIGHVGLNIQTENHDSHLIGVHNTDELKIYRYNHDKNYLGYYKALISLKNRKPQPNEFRVNEYITLRLKGKTTNIYVNGRKFDQCKFLMLNLEADKEYKEINSIDEAAEHLSRKMEHNHNIVPPETEFWGHCSNLQAWVENDYDLRIIHTNLGVPLLKELIKCGDQKAKIAWKEEIMYRIQETGFNAYETHKQDVNNYFNEDEKKVIYEKIFPNKEAFIKKILKMEFKDYIDLLERNSFYNLELDTTDEELRGIRADEIYLDDLEEELEDDIDFDDISFL